MCCQCLLLTALTEGGGPPWNQGITLTDGPHLLYLSLRVPPQAATGETTAAQVKSSKCRPILYQMSSYVKWYDFQFKQFWLNIEIKKLKSQNNKNLQGREIRICSYLIYSKSMGLKLADFDQFIFQRRFRPYFS